MPRRPAPIPTHLCTPIHQEHFKKEAEAFVAKLPASVQQRVKALEEINGKRFELEAQYKKEIDELEVKYNKLYGRCHCVRRLKHTLTRHAHINSQNTAPLYEERRKVVNPTENVATEAEGIPKFWATALYNLPMVQEHITQKDMEVLQYVTNVTTDKLPIDTRVCWR